MMSRIIFQLRALLVFELLRLVKRRQFFLTLLLLLLPTGVGVLAFLIEREDIERGVVYAFSENYIHELDENKLTIRLRRALEREGLSLSDEVEVEVVEKGERFVPSSPEFLGKFSLQYIKDLERGVLPEAILQVLRKRLGRPFLGKGKERIFLSYGRKEGWFFFLGMFKFKLIKQGDGISLYREKVNLYQDPFANDGRVWRLRDLQRGWQMRFKRQHDSLHWISPQISGYFFQQGVFVGIGKFLFLQLLLPLLCLLYATSMFRDEWEEGTLVYLLTVPFSRFWIVVGKYIGVILLLTPLFFASLLLLFLTLGVLVGGVFLSADFSLFFEFAKSLVFGVFAYTAFFMLFGLFLKRSTVAGIFYILLIELGLGSALVALQKLTISYHIANLIQREHLPLHSRKLLKEVLYEGGGNSLTLLVGVVVVGLVVSAVYLRCKEWEVERGA